MTDEFLVTVIVLLQGYVNRQALYACNTCTPTEMAGVCLACCLTCHDGHELYELYTKRYTLRHSHTPINIKPKGWGVSQEVGILTFSIKKKFPP